jgi:hypothetical protein
LNGSAISSASGIAADPGGDAFVTGVTTSTDFPVTAGAYQTTFASSSGQGRAAFVTKLNQTGTALEYSTYLGPPNYMAGNAIGLDTAGDAYVAGTMYPGGIAGGAPCPATNTDCGFIAKLDGLGARLEFSTLINLADSGYTQANSIAIDCDGGSHVVGNFGVSGTHFGFLQNLAPNGVTGNLVNLSNALSPNAIALGPSSNIFVAGTVFGDNLTTTPGAFQPNSAGSVNVFLNEYDPAGTSTLYSTYLGGSDQDEAFGLAVDASGYAYVTGYTQSSDFPVTPGALQSTHGGGIAHAGTLDAFVARIVPSPALSPSPTATATSKSTATPTASATATVTSTPTARRTPLPTRTPSPSTTPTAMSSPDVSIDASPNPLRFHVTEVGRTSAPEFVRVMNPNKVAVTVVSLALGSSGDFTIDASRSSCIAGLVLSAGESCRVAITFAPSSKGAKADTLMLNAGGIAKMIALLGAGK